MTCQITITPPIGEEDNIGQGITTLTISGTATDCSTVMVKVRQTEGVDVTTPEKAAIVENGQWSIDFTVEAGDFGLGTFLCGNRNKCIVDARCKEDPNCRETFTDSLINCTACPQVDITITPGACANGFREVHFRADVISTNNDNYIWFFGTDEDNQQGEDSQVGDGRGSFSLTPPGANGVRTVETEHIYEARNNQPQTINVRFVTLGGASNCTTQEEFTLEPCECDLTVALQILDQTTGQVIPSDECLPSGDYTLQVISPTDGENTFRWSVNGVSDSNSNDPTFNFSISTGEEKSITVSVGQGGCDASNGLNVIGCEDCNKFKAKLRVLDQNRLDVTDNECLPSGDYTLQVVSPTDGENTFRWSIDNVVDTTSTDTTLQVTLGSDDQKLITLEANRGECRDITSVILETCPSPIPIPDPINNDPVDPINDSTDSRDGFIPCLLLKALALVGLGFIFVGAVLLLCPTIAGALIPPTAALLIAVGLLVLGTALLVLGLLLWLLICKPDKCDWFAFLWQALILLGVVMVYAGFCPTCSWMLLGMVPLILGAGASIIWGRNCNVTRCRALSEWISLFTFVINIVGIVEFVLAQCVVTSQPIASIIWGLAIAAIQAWLWVEANRSNCIRF